MFAPVQPQPSGVVAQAAAAAALFKRGQLLEAVVLGKTAESLVVLKIGDVVVNAKLPQLLPPGTLLQLQVKTGGPAPQLAMVGTPRLPAATVAPLPIPSVPSLPPVTVAPLTATAPVVPRLPQPVVASSAVPAMAPQASVALPPAAASPGPAAATEPAAAPTAAPASAPPAPAVPAPPIAESAQPVVPATTTTASTSGNAPPAAPPPPSPAAPAQVLAGSPAVAPAPPPGAGSAASAAQAPTNAAPAPQVVPPSAPPPTGVAPPSAPVRAALPPTGAQSAPALPSARPAASTQVAPPVTASAAQPPPAPPVLPSQSAAVVSAPVSMPAPNAGVAPAGAEPAAPSPLLVAQGAVRPAATVADLPRPALPPMASAPPAAAPALPASPAAALAQMVPEALARQNSIAPLLAALATIVAKPGALPEPVLRAALQVLGQRVPLPPGGPTAPQLEAAIARSGVYLEPGLARGAPAADLKSGLVALKGALATWLGGNPAPVAPAQQVAPPLRGMPPRAEAIDPPPLPDAPRDAARLLHGQADAALSRVKLMQFASLPDADPARGTPPELRTEVPFLLGQQVVMAQFQVTRDGARHRSEGKRGWTMRFAMRLPSAGEVGAEVGLLGRSVNVALWAADAETSRALEAALPELAPALAALGLEPGAVRVRPLPPDAPRPASGQYVDSRR